MFCWEGGEYPIECFVGREVSTLLNVLLGGR